MENDLDLKQRLDRFSFPALLLDENLVIREKNSLVTNLAAPFRKGGSLTARLSDADAQCLRTLAPGAVANIILSAAAHDYGAFVQRQEDRTYIVQLRLMSAALQRRLGEAAEIGIALARSVQQYNDVILGSPDSVERRASRKDKAKMFLFQEHMARLLQVFKENPDEPRGIFDIADAVNTTLTYGADMLRQLDYNINLTPAAKERYALTDRGCLSAELAMLLHIAVSYCEKNRMHIECIDADRQLRILFKFNSLLSEPENERVMAGNYAARNFRCPNGTLFFDLLLIEVMASLHYWDFRAYRPDDTPYRMALALTVPLTKSDALPTLREPWTGYREIVERELRDILAGLPAE